MFPPPVVEQGVYHTHALGMEEREPRTLLVEAKKTQLAAQPAVVALPSHLQPLQVLLQLLGRRESGAVDAGEHGVLAVAAPVGPGYGQQPHRPDPAAVGYVRSPAQVEKLSLPVDAYGGLVRQIVDEFELVGLVGKKHERLLLADLAPLEWLTHGEKALDLFRDSGKVVLSHRLGELEIVVEAVLDRRADGDFGARIEAGCRLG